MRFTDIFIHRPVLAIVISSLLLLLGGASLSRVSLREFPEIDRVEWFDMATARRKINAAQVAFLDRLGEALPLAPDE